MPAPMTDRETEIAEQAVSLFAACEQTGAVGAPYRGRRVLVASGGHRFDVPATATAEIVQVVQQRLAGVFGACYLEADGTPVLCVRSGVTDAPAAQTSPSAGAGSISAILAARRAAANV